jgi:transcription termination factor NusB
MLENSGLLRVVVPEKKAAVNQILKALNLDSLERFNSPASRLRLASSIIKQATELIGIGKVINKYDRLSSLLILEREFERYCINEIIELSKRFLSLDPLQANILDAANYLALVTKEMFDHRNIKTAPYRVPAFRFLFSVYGIPKEKNKINISIFQHMFSSDPELIEEVKKIEAEKKSSTKDHSLASQLRFRERLVNCIELLEKTLDEGETNLPESYLNRQ